MAFPALPVMGDEPRHLGSEHEMFGSLLMPGLEKLQLRKPVKSDIQLQRIEPLRIVIEPKPLRQSLRVKEFLPVLIMKPRAPDIPVFSRMSHYFFVGETEYKRDARGEVASCQLQAASLSGAPEPPLVEFTATRVIIFPSNSS